jgi:hypothetical protein
VSFRFYPAIRIKDNEPSLEEIYRNKGVSAVSDALAEFLGDRIPVYVKVRDSVLAQFVDMSWAASTTFCPLQTS